MVVVILAVLTAVAVFAYSNYMRRARTQEAMAFLGDIHIKQQQFFQAYGRYLSSDNAASNYNDPGGYWPANIIPGQAQHWMAPGDTCGGATPGTPLGTFCMLGVRPATQVYFQYKTIGWNPNEAAFRGDPPNDTIPVAAWRDAGSRPWWYASARTKWTDDPGETAWVYVLYSVLLNQAIVKDAYAADFL